ncbi:ABC transporter ATP-binding protein [Kribbella speibonae]|uniref:ATP-binding cassette domain-containing protein n=1 Tax=Kribbella speibonae TaxID=1572660 RepID=A0A4R0IML5_9ACTN|nr:oligopeptide/dipeptide ABC transporter ATP-binding protein [Kribbella speibonae]TCC21780.1 ATP-binding cassette domain-containing protein [Kribbella speibonae]TCC34067.1 ATP-binding cassette domain-containing protein [Kribbella speibonae]
MTLLETRGLTMHFPLHGGFLGRNRGFVKAVDGVDLSIKAGRTLGLVGESGCGKTTLGRCIVRAYEPTSGSIMFDGVDLAPLSEKQLKPYRAQVRLIFQDPHSSLDPRKTLRDIIAEPLRVQESGSRDEIDDKVAALLRRVGLRAEYAHRYPHAFSGGERQRVVIARALATEPRLVVADEAVSALDVSVRAQILNLLRDLQEESGLTYLFVSHDLGIVEHVADDVAVMYVGKLVESASTEELYSKPLHPYTEALLSAVPDPDPASRGQRERIKLLGEIADPSKVPAGCPFHPRCGYAEARCKTEVPQLREIGGRKVACHFAEQLDLKGVLTATTAP